MKIITAPKQCQLLLQQTRNLTFEGKQSRGYVAVCLVICPDTNGRVGSISPRLIADQHVKVVKITSRQQQGIVRRAKVYAGVNTQHPTSA